jgi:hypothetical protein
MVDGVNVARGGTRAKDQKQGPGAPGSAVFRIPSRIEFSDAALRSLLAIGMLWPPWRYVCLLAERSAVVAVPLAARDAAPSETLLFTLAPTRAASLPRGVDQHWQNASLRLLLL